MSRNANGDGSLRKKREGLWEYRVMVGYDEDQHAIRKSFYGKTKTEAKNKYKEWLKQSEPLKLKKQKPLGNGPFNGLKSIKRGKWRTAHTVIMSSTLKTISSPA